jgi:hypothetical protein
MNRKTLSATAFAFLVLVFFAPTVLAEDHVPQPYDPQEFPGWTHDIWRAEAVFAGSFPFALFVTFEAYDIFRYVKYSFNPSYAPWPFGSGVSAPYSTTETTWLAVSAVSLSLVIAGIDFILTHIHDKPTPKAN